jgi:methylated-DNA-protein-cysteine methyltransferase-like protein
MTKMKSSPEPADASRDETIVSQIHDIVRAIPRGKVLSYGAVGARSTPAISGYICGRITRTMPEDVPWWRVVGKNGNLPIRKRHPELSILQREKLEAEGVEFDENDCVKMEEFSLQL